MNQGLLRGFPLATRPPVVPIGPTIRVRFQNPLNVIVPNTDHVECIDWRKFGRITKWHVRSASIATISFDLRRTTSAGVMPSASDSMINNAALRPGLVGTSYASGTTEGWLSSVLNPGDHWDLICVSASGVVPSDVCVQLNLV